MATTYGTTSASGTQIGIVGGDPATYDGAGFTALVYKNIGKIKNAGEFGKQFNLITNEYLSQRGQEKRKGTFNAGTLTVEVDIKSDEGQALCETALDDDEDYNFKISLKNGAVYYVRGQVTQFTTHIGAPNDMLSATIGIELNPFFNALGDELAAIKVEPV